MSDLQGFPGRFSYDESGGLQRDRFPVTKPDEQLSLRTMSALRWQVAGLNKTGTLVSLTITAGGVKVSGGEAWNTEDDPTLRCVPVRVSTGRFTITAPAATALDWSGTLRSIVFSGALVTPQSAVDVRGSYVIESATQITVRLRDTAGSLIDCAFTVDIK